ncbi:MAG: hypothetical protein QF486_01375 [Candidatus Woesearchaeota archaeon]|jgi:hypothetical protein|nr:hypothetical protein [Candidatus Woesearchaeota archaeon]MDP7181133.1 hypothetical protein [Candidatus Woesearchaeota archaeon]MDP7198246.1 hypothetical protein [Candidatus Woesearchaeota archaeon]MDP7467082.1 hypothetical protein [Candidatus Woesearchaeota archaeon]MDP7646750.1 hypothetical protein [Candidatus Woesearchaeota archaeon]
MSKGRLEDILEGILAAGSAGILIIQDSIDYETEVQGEIYREHIINKGAIDSFPEIRRWSCLRSTLDHAEGSRVHVIDHAHWRVREKLTGSEYGHDFTNTDLVLAIPNEASPWKLADLIATARLVEQVRAHNPDSQALIYVPGATEGLLMNTYHSMVSLFTGPNGPELAAMLEGIDREEFPTLMHKLCHALYGNVEAGRRRQAKLSEKAHAYKNDMWKDRYLPYIDVSLRAGNTQTLQNNYFLVLSHREMENLLDNEPVADEKVKVRLPTDAQSLIAEEDLSKVAAIFVDNDWFNHSTALGMGIETLRQVREALDTAGLTIPIIYQSGHEPRVFTEAELSEIRDLGAILQSKDVFPKVCAGPASEREVLLSEIAQQNEFLRPYTIEVAGVGTSHGDTHVVLTKIVDEGTGWTTASTILSDNFDIEPSLYSSRMYVLAGWHKIMRPYKDRAEFVPNQPHFLAWDVFKKTLGDRIEKYENLYIAIASNPAHHEKKTVSHNDAKDDNWFQGIVLGDYSNASVGAEYKDVARSMECRHDDNKIALSVELTTEQVENYKSIRSNMDDAFTEEDFSDRVYEAMFTENLRLANWNAILGDQGRMEAHLRIADVWFNYLDPRTDQASGPPLSIPCVTRASNSA